MSAFARRCKLEKPALDLLAPWATIVSTFGPAVRLS
jgi:hypothetical protein